LARFFRNVSEFSSGSILKKVQGRTRKKCGNFKYRDYNRNYRHRKRGGRCRAARPPISKIQNDSNGFSTSRSTGQNPVFRKNTVSTTARQAEPPALPKPQPSEPARPAGTRNLKLPTFETYRQVTGRYPPTAAEPLIQAAGIETGANLQFWEEVMHYHI
jgi:hypothetical protein